jgi:AAA domain-containing protein
MSDENVIPIRPAMPGELIETHQPLERFLTLDQWRTRDLPPPDYLLGEVFHTTTRVLLAAATGLGKTNFSIALGMRMAAGIGFLHWAARRPCKVLYIDGEMSRRLLRQRLLDEETRVLSEVAPSERASIRQLLAANFHALSTEDVENFQPLNTPAGQAMVNKLIEDMGSCDLAIFDNSMSLIAGSMKEEDSWAQVQPWANSLSKRSVGQLWVHHTNDQDKLYGTKTRAWQMGAVILLTKAERDGTDVSFALKFDKARERTPHNRNDFREVNVCLLNNEWQSSGPIKDCAPGLRTVTDAINEALIDHGILHPIEDGPSVRAVEVKFARKIHEKRYVHDGEGDRFEAERKAWRRNFKKALDSKIVAGDGAELVWIV